MTEDYADRVARLASDILGPIADKVAAAPVRHPPLSAAQREVLQALAFVAANAIASAGDHLTRLEARSFLSRTMEDMMGELLADPPRPPLLPLRFRGVRRR